MRFFSLLLAAASFVLCGSTAAPVGSTGNIDQIVKLYLPSSGENGSGTIVGSNAQVAFVLTAAHVVLPDNYDPDEAPPLPEIHVLINELLTTGRRGPQVEVPAQLVHFNQKMDLAVVSVALADVQNQSSSGAAVQIGQLGFARTADAECLLGAVLEVEGFAGGGTFAPDITKVQLQAFHYYDNQKFYRTSARGLEGGHSGAPVFGQNGPVRELSGMAVELNGDYTAAKVLKLKTVLAELWGNKIPTNNLRESTYTRKWRPAMLILKQPDNPAAQVEPHPIVPGAFADLELHRDGLASGMAKGTYCISGKYLRFNIEGNYGVMMEIRPANGGYGTMQEVLSNEQEYEIELSYNPLNETEVMYLKLKCPTYDVWLHPAF